MARRILSGGAELGVVVVAVVCGEDQIPHEAPGRDGDHHPAVVGHEEKPKTLLLSNSSFDYLSRFFYSHPYMYIVFRFLFFIFYFFFRELVLFFFFIPFPMMDFRKWMGRTRNKGGKGRKPKGKNK